MLIKVADDKRQRLMALEAAMRAPGAGKAEKEAYYTCKAGIRGETEAAYFIDFDYGEASKNWAVIHDLRLEHGGRTAQIDHLLINRFLEIYALETKHFQSGVKITEDGEFLRWNDYRKSYEPMESPIAQNARHISVLRDVCSSVDFPERLGIRLQPSLHSFVLMSNKAKIYRPKRFDTSSVIKMDQLKGRIDRDLDNVSVFGAIGKVSKLVSAAAVQSIAEQLASRHRPLRGKSDAMPAAAVDAVSAQASSVAPNKPESVSQVAETQTPYVVTPLKRFSGPTCKTCGKGIGTIQYGHSYYFKCAHCNANTTIRFTCQPGHKPRLRKAGNVFFRDCAECGTSEPFHANPTRHD